MIPQHPDNEANQGKQDGDIRHGPHGGPHGGESSVTVGVVAGDQLPGSHFQNENSKDKANRGVPYIQIARPDDPRDAVAAIDVWARYLHHWGVRVDQEFHGLYAKLQAAGTPTTRAAGTATMHLDPPPEPFK